MNFSKMRSSSSSDDDDSEQIKQFLAAADTNLLNDSLYQKNERPCEITNEKQEAILGDKPKSQRYLQDEDENQNIGVDVNLPDSTQRHIAKKLSELIERRVEFIEPVAADLTKPTKSKVARSRIRLLSDSSEYVKAFEDYEEQPFVQNTKRPKIGRRQVEHGNALSESDRIKIAAIDAANILNGSETKHWATKKEHPSKVFHYKMTKSKMLEFQEPVNEFTSLRRKNNWNENKIKRKKVK